MGNQQFISLLNKRYQQFVEIKPTKIFVVRDLQQKQLKSHYIYKYSISWLDKAIRQLTLYKTLNHPKLYKLQNFFLEQMMTNQDKSIHYHLHVVTQFINHENCLKHFVGKLSIDNILKIYDQMKSIVQCMDELNIFCYVLDLDKIITDQSFNIKIIEFGMDYLFTQEELLGQYDQEYLAPEIFQGKISESSNLWSIGIIILELFFGQKIQFLYGAKPAEDKSFPQSFFEKYDHIIPLEIITITKSLLQRDYIKRTVYGGNHQAQVYWKKQNIQKLDGLNLISRRRRVCQPDTSQFYQKGVLYFQAKNYKSAEKYFRRCLNKKHKMSYIYLANILIKLNRTNQAQQLYTRGISQVQNFSAAYCNRGTFYQNKGEFENALIDYDQAIKLNPKYTLAYHNRGLLYQKLNQQIKSISDYSNAIQCSPKFLASYFQRAIIYQKHNQLQKAQEDYNKVLQIDPKYLDAYLNRGSLYELKKEYDKAIKDYDEAIKYDNTLQLAYLQRGLLNQIKNQFQKALEDFNKAIELDPKYSRAYCNRGFVYIKLKQFDKALLDHNKVIQLNPKAVIPYCNRGKLFKKRNQIYKALLDYNTAIQIDSSYQDAYYKRGTLYQDQKQYDKALMDYNKVIELNPKFSMGYCHRGMIYHSKKELQKSLQDYEKSIQIDQNYFAYYNRGILFHNLKEYQKAINNFNKAIQYDSSFYNCYRSRGKSYFNLSLYDLALSDFLTSIKQTQNHQSCYYLGKIYLLKKNLTLSMTYIQKSIQLNPHRASPYLYKGIINDLSESSIEAEINYSIAFRTNGSKLDLLKQLYKGLKNYDD